MQERQKIEEERLFGPAVNQASNDSPSVVYCDQRSNQAPSGLGVSVNQFDYRASVQQDVRSNHRLRGLSFASNAVSQFSRRDTY